jgi:hypothetical protein
MDPVSSRERSTASTAVSVLPVRQGSGAASKERRMGSRSIARGLASQLLASLYMLKDCMDRCPLEEWHERHGDYPFSQVLFHALFDCDYHLCDSDEEFKEQLFHRENPDNFGDYEELEDRVPPHLQDYAFMIGYYEHCREKIASAMETKDEGSLITPNADIRKNMTRLERYVNLIRHVQHHAAQLGLRLQLVTGKEMEWISRGYGN